MRETTKLITVKEVLKKTGYKSRTTLWRRVRAGNFPKPIALSPHATRWKEQEVEDWIAALPEIDYAEDNSSNEACH
ncbi:MAG: AlpA family phage regulatory protein [Pseudomonadota bacterium]